MSKQLSYSLKLMRAPNEILWSKAVKKRDGYKCVLCGGEEELVVRDIEGKGNLEVSEGVTLCARCDSNGKCRPEDVILERKPTIRVNLEVDGDLWAIFMVKCKTEKISLSDAIRSYMEKEIQNGK